MESEIEKVVHSSFWDFKGNEEYIDNYFLMGSPFPCLLILGTYLLFVLKLGPQFMKNRPAYKLRNVLLVYNALQVAYSMYLTYTGIKGISERGLLETKCTTKDPVLKKRVASAHYLYFLAKLTELLDTVFFVLRKKWDQITFLHVYHHALMYSSTWFTLKYEPTYSVAFLGCLNSFVHVIMYTYYGLSAFPNLQKYLWWKAHLTKLQLIQFILILAQITWNFYSSECPASYILNSVCLFNILLFIYLFAEFYLKRYKNKKRDSNIKTRERGSQLEIDKLRSNVNAKAQNNQTLTNKNR